MDAGTFRLIAVIIDRVHLFSLRSSDQKFIMNDSYQDMSLGHKNNTFLIFPLWYSDVMFRLGL